MQCKLNNVMALAVLQLFYTIKFTICIIIFSLVNAEKCNL